MSAISRAAPSARLLRLLLGAGAALAVLAAAPARADYRDSVPVLRIGLVDARVAAVDPAKLDSVSAAFSSALGLPVEIVRMSSYAALIDAHAPAAETGRRLDLRWSEHGWLSALHGARRVVAERSRLSAVAAPKDRG